MKKQLLLMPLIGLLCFTSCNKGGRELKPVDDKTGLERAQTILGKELSALDQLEESGDPFKIFEILPHNISYEQKMTNDGKVRTYIPDSKSEPIEEVSINNLLIRDTKFDVDCDTLQLHFYSYYYDPIDLSERISEYNFFYDQTKSECYLLTYVKNPSLPTPLEKTKKIIPTENIDMAKGMFSNLLKSNIGKGAISQLFPVAYLANITDYDETNQNYYLLEDYERVQKYFDLYGNNGEYLKHQFGSNDENSLSLKNDIKVAMHKIPALGDLSDFLIADGYTQGMATASYNEELSFIGNYYLFTGFVPDLVVIKDNYLNYASSTAKVDVDSLAQFNFPAGAFYQHTTEKTTFETTENVKITNPNPDEYELAE